MSSRVKRRTFLLGVPAALALPLYGCSGLPAMPRLAMGCGAVGGRYLQFGEILGELLAERRAFALEALVTNGSSENLQLLSARRADLAISLADTAEHSAAGLLAIGRVYQNYLQCIVREDSDIGGIHELARKTVAIGAPGSGSSFTTVRLLEALGMRQGPHAVVEREMSLSDSLADLATGALDAVFWSGGVPTPRIEQFGRTIPVKLIDLAYAITLLGDVHHDVYRETSVPAGVYGAERPTGTIGIPNFLLADARLPDSAAQQLVDMLIDRAPDLVPQGSAGMQFLTPANLIDTGAIPLHPAAQQRYRERYG